MMEIVLMVLLCGGGTAAALLVQRARGDERLLRMKRVDIAKLGDNERRRIGGTIRALGGTIEAPLTGRPCVYYEVQVHEDADDLRYGTDSSTHEAIGVPFVLEDETGTAIVDPLGADVKRLYERMHGKPPAFDAARLLAVLAEHGYPAPNAACMARLYLSEAVLAPGDEIDLVGAGIREADPDGASDGYRSTPTRIRMAATEKSALCIVKSRRGVTGEETPFKPRKR